MTSVELQVTVVVIFPILEVREPCRMSSQQGRNARRAGVEGEGVQKSLALYSVRRRNSGYERRLVLDHRSWPIVTRIRLMREVRRRRAIVAHTPSTQKERM